MPVNSKKQGQGQTGKKHDGAATKASKEQAAEKKAVDTKPVASKTKK